MAITGGCLCKKVRYQIAADKPLGVRQCWCRLCQYLSADSGATMHRRFCPACGTPLFSEAEPHPHLIVVRVGTLDDPELGRPEAVIWTRSAPKWACFDPALPRVEGQPAPAK
jgi:hypothetical protein